MTWRMATNHVTCDIVHTLNTGTEDFTDVSFSVRLTVDLQIKTTRRNANDLWRNGLLLVESDRLDVELRLFSENNGSSEKCRSIVFESDLHQLTSITELITMQPQQYASQQQTDYLSGVIPIVFPELDEVMPFMWFVPCECMFEWGERNEMFPPIVARLSQPASNWFLNKQRRVQTANIISF